MIKRGNICWIDLDPIKGSEIGKIRPAIIISNDINNKFSDTITILPITSTTNKIYPFEVFIPKNTTNLKEDSKIKTNQIRTVDKSRLKKTTGSISKDLLIKTEAALKIHLNIT